MGTTAVFIDGELWSNYGAYSCQRIGLAVADNFEGLLIVDAVPVNKNSGCGSSVVTASDNTRTKTQRSFALQPGANEYFRRRQWAVTHAVARICAAFRNACASRQSFRYCSPHPATNRITHAGDPRVTRCSTATAAVQSETQLESLTSETIGNDAKMLSEYERKWLAILVVLPTRRFADKLNYRNLTITTGIIFSTSHLVTAKCSEFMNIQ